MFLRQTVSSGAQCFRRNVAFQPLVSCYRAGNTLVSNSFLPLRRQLLVSNFSTSTSKAAATPWLQALQRAPRSVVARSLSFGAPAKTLILSTSALSGLVSPFLALNAKTIYAQSAKPPANQFAIGKEHVLQRTQWSAPLPLRIAAFAWMVVVGTTMALVSLVLCTLTWILTHDSDRTRELVGNIVQRLCIQLPAKLNPLWSFQVDNAPLQRPTKPTVYICNHLSNADAFLVLSQLPFDVKSLAKGEVQYLPIVGWLLSLAGHIFIGFKDDNNRADGFRATNRRQVLDDAVTWLKKGAHVIIFPEGWRSRTGELLYFKDGAFEVAVRAGADIVPIAISGTHNQWPCLDWIPDYGRSYASFGAPISTDGMELDDVPALKARAREEISRMKEELDSRI